MKVRLWTIVVAALLLASNAADACTGLRLTAQDGAVVFGRTQEWGTFDLRSRVVIIPRGYAIQTELPDGKPGIGWKTKYGAVGLDVLEKNVIVDGMNEKGLTVNLFYHEGFAEYPEYDPRDAAKSIPILALAPYILTTADSIDDANFNLTVGAAAAEGGGEVNQEGMRSSTIWTTAYDTKNLALYYHTQHNRRVRQVDFKKIDFSGPDIVRIPLDREKSQDVDDVTPKR